MNKVTNFLKAYRTAVLVPVLMIVLLLILSPETRSVSAVMLLIQQGFAPAILGWGVLFGMQVGNWDFSIGARYVLSGIIGGNLAMQLHMGIFGFILFTMIFSMLFAVICAAMYMLLNIPTMIVTIGLAMIYESITRIIYSGNGVHLTTDYMALGKFPANLIVFIILFALASFIYYKRKIGYNVRAVGSNPVVAQTNGINARKVKAIAMILSGIFTGIFAVQNISNSGVCSSVSGTLGSMGTVFDAMMCVLIGMAIAGKGNIMFAVFSGAITTQILKMGMIAIGVPSTYNKVIIGALVVICMVSSTRRDLWSKIGAKFHKKRSAVN